MHYWKSIFINFILSHEFYYYFPYTESPFDAYFFTKIYCVGGAKSTLMSISDGLGAYIFRRKAE